MPKDKVKLQKHTMHLEAGQFERLAVLHPNIPGSVILRRLINAYLEQNAKMLDVHEIKFEKDVSL
jgi:hypothetical protein